MQVIGQPQSIRHVSMELHMLSVGHPVNEQIDMRFE